MMLLPYVDTVYQFKFASPFSIVDGIYKVLRIMTFDEMLSDSINLVELYTKAGKTEEDYNADTPTLRTDKILKLKHVESEEILHIPNTFNLYEPDPDVKMYAKLALAVNLGIFDNEQQIEFAQHTIESVVDKGLGVSTSTLLFSTKDVWLTVAEYNEHVKERTARKNSLVNLYSETFRLRKELDKSNKKMTYYENKLLALSNTNLQPELYEKANELTIENDKLTEQVNTLSMDLDSANLKLKYYEEQITVLKKQLNDLTSQLNPEVP